MPAEEPAGCWTSGSETDVGCADAVGVADVTDATDAMDATDATDATDGCGRMQTLTVQDDQMRKKTQRQRYLHGQGLKCLDEELDVQLGGDAERRPAQFFNGEAA